MDFLTRSLNPNGATTLASTTTSRAFDRDPRVRHNSIASSRSTNSESSASASSWISNDSASTLVLPGSSTAEDEGRKSSRRADSISAVSTSGSSVSTTFEWQQQEQRNANKFNNLRHDFVEEPEDLDDGELIVENPSMKKGDIRTFSPKVTAKVTVWDDGALTSGKGKKRPKLDDGQEQWFLEGVLWITRKNEVIFIIDPTVEPHRTVVDHSSQSRRTSSIFYRGKSRQSLSRERSESPAAALAHAYTESSHQSSASTSSESSHGLKSFVKKLFHSSHSDASEDHSKRLALSRTVSPGGNTARLSLSRSRSPEPSTQRRPTLPNPLPSISSRPITALYISTPKLIQSVHYRPAHASRSTRSMFRSSTTESNRSAKSHQGSKSVGASPPESPGDHHSASPSVELDVANPELGARSVEEQGKEGKQREVSIVFLFEGGGLLSTEAEDFHAHLRDLMDNAHRSTT